MVTRYGKLNLLNPSGPEQEFELAKASISLGRASTNNIILDDVRVSRSHALLECGPQRVTLVDLGSANGTRVNGKRIKRATLKPGDTISLGSQQLKYRVDDPSEDVGLTAIDTEEQLEETLNEEYLPLTINETGHPNLVVFTRERTWSIDLRDLDQVSIGRDESAEVFIDAEKVSRRHAEVLRKGDAFLLNDLGSTNGTWLRGQPVDQVILQHGDVFRVGSAQIAFKQGFQEQALTMAEEQMGPSGRRTVIFVPGLMGSELWLGSERVWPSVKTMFANPELFVYPSDHPLEPRSIVDEVVIVPNLIKQDQYNRLGDYLVDELNYVRHVDYFEFPYDWRQDVRTSAAQLGQMIENLESDRPIVLIGHSLGTLVIRYYAECLGADRRVERIMLMGGPHKGAVKGLVSILVAPEVLPLGIMGDRLRKILATFPSCYQILPEYAAGVDQHGADINFFDYVDWLDPAYRSLLKGGKRFRQELKPSAATTAVSIFGYGIKTISSVLIRRDAAGKMEDVDYVSDNIGDGSVLEQSAVLPGSEIHPVHQHHGTLFVDNDVKMRLKLELLRPY